MQTDHLARVPREILDIILDECDVISLLSLSTLCKRLHERIEREEMWKKQAIKIWTAVPAEEAHNLVWIVDSLSSMTWKKMTMHLCNLKRGKYRSQHSPHSLLLEYSTGESSPILVVRNSTIFGGDMALSGKGQGWKILKESGRIFQGNFNTYNLHGQGKQW